MEKIALLVAIGLFVFFNIHKMDGQSIRVKEDCGRITSIQPLIFDLEELTQSDKNKLNEKVNFLLDNKPYSFYLKNDKNLLVYYHMFEMLYKANKHKTFVNVEYKLDEGEKRIVSMAFCKKNKDHICPIK